MPMPTVRPTRTGIKRETFMILLTHINEIAGLPNEPFFIPLTYSTSNGLLSDIQYISLVKRGAGPVIRRIGHRVTSFG